MSTTEVVQYSLCEDHHHHHPHHHYHNQQQAQNIGCMTSFLHHILDRIQILTGRRLRRHKRIRSDVPSGAAPPPALSTPQTSSTTNILGSTRLQFQEEEGPACEGQGKKSSSLITDKKHDLLQPLHEVDETFSNDDNPVEDDKDIHRMLGCSSKASVSGSGKGVGVSKSKEAFLKSSRSLQEGRHGSGLDFGRDCKEPRRFSTSCGLDHQSHPSSSVQGQLLDIRDIVRACIFKEPAPCTPSLHAEHQPSNQKQAAPPSAEKRRKSWKFPRLERKETCQLSGNVSSDEMETDENRPKPGSSSTMMLVVNDANVCKQSMLTSECRKSGKKNPSGEDIIIASTAASSSYSSDAEETPRNASVNMHPFPNASDPSSSCNRLKPRRSSKNLVARLMGLEEIPASERPTQLSTLQVHKAPSQIQETLLDDYKTTLSNHKSSKIARQLQVEGPMTPFGVEMLTPSQGSSSLPPEILDVGDVHDTLLNTLHADRVQLHVEKQKHESVKEECTRKELRSQQSLVRAATSPNVVTATSFIIDAVNNDNDNNLFWMKPDDYSNSLYKDLDMVLQDLKHNPTHQRQDTGRLMIILEEIRVSSLKKALPQPGEMSPRFPRGIGRSVCGREEEKKWRKCLFPEKEHPAGRTNSWQPQPTGNVEDREGTSSKLVTMQIRCCNSQPSGSVMGRVGSKMALDQDQCTSTSTHHQLSNLKSTYSIENGTQMNKRRIPAIMSQHITGSAGGPCKDKEAGPRATPILQCRSPTASSTEILVNNRTMESKGRKLNKCVAKSLSPALDALPKVGSTGKLRTGGSVLTVTPELHHCLSPCETKKEEPKIGNGNRNVDTFCMNTELCLEANMRAMLASEGNKNGLKLEQCHDHQYTMSTTAGAILPQILSGGDITELLRVKEEISAKESNAKRHSSTNEQPSPVSVLDQDAFSSSCEDSSPTTGSSHSDRSMKQIRGHAHAASLDGSTDFCVNTESRECAIELEERVISLSSSSPGFEDKNTSSRKRLSPVDPKLLCHLINELVLDKMQHHYSNSTLLTKPELPWMMAMANDLRSSSSLSPSEEAEYNTLLMNEYWGGGVVRKERLAKNVRQEVEELVRMANSTNPDLWETLVHLLEWDISLSGWQWNANVMTTPSSLADVTVAVECSIWKGLVDETARDAVQIMQRQKCERLTAIRRQLF